MTPAAATQERDHAPADEELAAGDPRLGAGRRPVDSAAGAGVSERASAGLPAGSGALPRRAGADLTAGPSWSAPRAPPPARPAARPAWTPARAPSRAAT